MEQIAATDTPVCLELYRHYADNLRRAVDSVMGKQPAQRREQDLATLFHSNLNRFAAYKAYHATEQVRNAVKKDGVIEDGRMVMHVFNRYQAAEYNTTVSRTRTAKQFAEFTEDDNMRLFPCIRWLPSRSANPREEHMPFYNRVWRKDDPFWNNNQPGNLWNCKCDWEETDDEPTHDNPATPVRHNGLEGNPAITGEIFTDNSAYIQSTGKNRKERDIIELYCQAVNKLQTIKLAKENLCGKTTDCTIDGKQYKVEFIGRGIDHYARDIWGDKSIFWLKNEILTHIQEYIKIAKCVGRKKSDIEHSTNKETIKLKKQTDYFYYFTIELPNRKEVFLHLGRYNEKKAGKEDVLYLYSITNKAPKNMEEI